MWPKSADNLSLEELEVLIWQRRARVKRPFLVGQPTSTVPTKPPAVRSRRRKRWEKTLLLAEILVIVGLLLLTGISARGWLALRQKLPLEGVTMIGEQVLTASPVETTETATLPPIGWRRPPWSDQTASIGIEAQQQPIEPPAHLQRWLQPDLTAPTVSLAEPVAQPATRIVIPAIKVDAPVGKGTDWESLKYQVGHHPGTANPGQRGNMVLAAHNDIYGEIFRYLPDVPLGEVITVYAEEETFRYRIVERRIIRPEQVEVMLPTTGPTVTLISCYPYLIDSHRIVLFGELVQ